MRLLYPCDPFDKKVPDEQYAEEYAAVAAAGLPVSLFSFEDFEAGIFRAWPALVADEAVLYRGWMITLEAYARLVEHIHEKGAQAVTSPAQYRHCHHLPEWYPTLAAHTSETRFLSADADFVQELRDLDWPGYFIKDHVKSLNTGGGSLVDRPEEITPLIERMRQYRGHIEGGVCVRRREDYLEESERRYFVVHGQPWSAEDGPVPALVRECASVIESPFFSVDVVLRKDGVLRLVELGDGQVSDRKEWSGQRFAWMLGQVFQASAQKGA